MGELVEFPRKPLEGDVPRLSDGTLLRECYEHVHVFDSIPGRCQCGSNQWPDGAPENEQWIGANAAVVAQKATNELREETGDESLTVVFDMRPLLSPEKPRKWPEDFRGFGSNVRPKRS